MTVKMYVFQLNRRYTQISKDTHIIYIRQNRQQATIVTKIKRILNEAK